MEWISTGNFFWMKMANFFRFVLVPAILFYMGSPALALPQTIFSVVGEDSVSGHVNITEDSEMKEMLVECSGELARQQFIDPRYPAPYVEILVKSPVISFKKKFVPVNGRVEKNFQLPKELFYFGVWKFTAQWEGAWKGNSLALSVKSFF